MILAEVAFTREAKTLRMQLLVGLYQQQFRVFESTYFDGRCVRNRDSVKSTHRLAVDLDSPRRDDEVGVAELPKLR